MDDYPYDLGTYRRAVSGTPEAATWVNRGLVWLYGYNHEAAIGCFERAAGIDPGCALAHWGIAHALGPNYNYTWELMDPKTRADRLARAWAAMERAQACAAGASPPERALVDALEARYGALAPPADFAPWNEAFAARMVAAHAAFPDDPDIAALAGEALLVCTPWRLWDLEEGAPASGARTLEARALIEGALARPGGRDHPGLLHFHIHLMEMSPEPEVALTSADRLRMLVPDAGHLCHMPSHIDILVGDYGAALEANRRAIAADEAWRRRDGAIDFYTGYRIHDFHFAAYAAMFMGKYEAASQAARGIWDSVPLDLLRIDVPPMAAYFESYFSIGSHVLVRFGKWTEILAAELPPEPDLFRTTTAMARYARGVAHAALGDVRAARAEQVLFEAARARVPGDWLLHNNTCGDLLAIAARMLEGEILYREGRFDAAFAALRAAVAAEDGLPYDEPWGWMQPVRHALGALLFEQGRHEEAEQVYREDLGLVAGMRRAQIHPDNVWALRGLMSCLAVRGARETGEGRLIAQRLQRAEARADGPIGVSCFCARG